jgi:hypothetical protein
MQFRRRTLLIVLALGPPLLAFGWLHGESLTRIVVALLVAMFVAHLGHSPRWRMSE